MISLNTLKESLALLSLPVMKHKIKTEDEAFFKFVSLDKTKVKILDLQGCQDAAVDLVKDGNIKFFWDLEKLNVSSCDISAVPKQLLELVCLTELNLSNNLLSEVPDEINVLSRLNKLNLSKNKLRNLPNSMSKLPLKYLNISHNRLVKMPQVFYLGLNLIQVLDASNNSLQEMEPPPRCFETLVHLNLSENCLVRVPTWIFHDKCTIREFDVSWNHLLTEIKVICTNIINVATLTCLKLQNCNLISKNLSFLSHLRNIRALNIGNGSEKAAKNYFHDLRLSVFSNCTKLYSLLMQNVELSVMSDDLEVISQIQVLDLSKNHISWLPESFRVLESLTTCVLSWNDLLFLPKELKRFKSLRVLRLDHNRLESFPDAVKDLPALEFLDLYDNKVESVPRDVLEMGLKGADLSLNHLGDLGEEWEGLKEGYRAWLGRQEGRVVVRCEGQKSVEEVVWESDDRSGHDSYEEWEEELEEKEEGNTEVVVTADWPEENWEIESEEDSDEDQAFDPNELMPLSLIRLAALKDQAMSKIKDNFCPADWHAPSHLQTIASIKRLRKVSSEAEEGQFDSD